MKRLLLCLVLLVAATATHAQQRPNIMLVTVDDMNWNSVGAFGNGIADITPQIDRLAESGVRFHRAYTAAANCSPSRVAIQTGLYPQQSGARGFYYIDDSGMATIATFLKEHGYVTGIVNKAPDTDPSPQWRRYWDDRSGFRKVDKYSAAAYADRCNSFFDLAQQSGKPFYFVVNIADPHKPFFNDQRASKNGFDVNEPSRIISEEEVSIPGFVPDLPGVRQDVRNYYNSVKRADDCVGAIMQALQSRGLAEETLVIFLSDHGMPLPMAKSTVYDNGLRTPLIVRWPEGLPAGKAVQNDIVSVVDLFPTLADAIGEPLPADQDFPGQSLLPIVNEQASADDRVVFGNFDENARGIPRPSRGAISQRYNYVFNAWAVGGIKFASATMHHPSYKAMVNAARTDATIWDRVQFIKHRTVEELYDLEKDPDCLNNLVGDPAYADALQQMQAALRQHMETTKDYLLEAFLVKDDPEALKAFMDRQEEAAQHRAERLQWKRPQNLAGNAKNNTLLYQPSQ